jgi:AraC-like DNA-binding protein
MKTYLRHRSLNVIDVKELIALEYLDFEGKYKDYTEKHDFGELCYVECGEVSLRLGDREEVLFSGEIIYIEPGVEHSYASPTGNKSRAFVICFACPSHALKLLSGVRFPPDSDVGEWVSKIVKESESTFRMNENDLLEVVAAPGFGGQQAIILLLEYLLIALVRRLSSEKSSNIVFLRGDKFYSELTDIVIGYLKSNADKRITLSDVCERFNYSRSFLCRIFKEQTGESLISYFNRLKLEEAKRLLKETKLSVVDISELLGFSEAKYFGSVFKKEEGISPLAYRAREKCKEQ